MTKGHSNLQSKAVRLLDRLISDRHVRLWTVIGGMAALIALVLSVAALNNGEDSQADSAGRGAPDGASSSQSSLPSISPSSDSPTPTDSSSITQTPIPPSEESNPEPIHHQGPITLVEGSDEEVYMDAPQSDPRWSEGDDPGYGDVSLQPGGVLDIYAAQVLHLGSEKASYDVCSSRTGYGGQDASGDLLLPVDRLKGHECIELNSGRFARVITKESTKGKATLDITVWDAE